MQSEISIRSIGHWGMNALQEAQSASVLGITSQGIFLLVDQQNVVFLSTQRFHGPLTANVEALPQHKLKIGQQVDIHLPSIRTSDISFHLPEHIIPWKPAPFRIPLDALQEIEISMQNLSEIINRMSAHNQYGKISKIAAERSLSIHEKKKMLLEKLGTNRDQSKTEHNKSNLHFLQQQLGRGNGLTPEGDDLVCGYILTRYYQGKLERNVCVDLARLARERTTSLSACLIECAVEGGADERVLNALHYLADGNGNPEKILEELLSYGSSSGIATLAGMLLALYLP
jgi:hypothetical protein